MLSHHNAHKMLFPNMQCYANHFDIELLTAQKFQVQYINIAKYYQSTQVAAQTRYDVQNVITRSPLVILIDTTW